MMCVTGIHMQQQSINQHLNKPVDEATRLEVTQVDTCLT